MAKPARNMARMPYFHLMSAMFPAVMHNTPPRSRRRWIWGVTKGLHCGEVRLEKAQYPTFYKRAPRFIYLIFISMYNKRICIGFCWKRLVCFICLIWETIFQLTFLNLGWLLGWGSEQIHICRRIIANGSVNPGALKETTQVRKSVILLGEKSPTANC